jgi:hypothetical protein
MTEVTVAVPDGTLALKHDRVRRAAALLKNDIARW